MPPTSLVPDTCADPCASMEHSTLLLGSHSWLHERTVYFRKAVQGTVALTGLEKQLCFLWSGGMGTGVRPGRLRITGRGLSLRPLAPHAAEAAQRDGRASAWSPDSGGFSGAHLRRGRGPFPPWKAMHCLRPPEIGMKCRGRGGIPDPGVDLIEVGRRKGLGVEVREGEHPGQGAPSSR